MRIVPFVNTLILVFSLAVITCLVIMITQTGYNDKVTHSCFILQAANGFLLLTRAAFKSDEEVEEVEDEAEEKA